MSINSVTLPRLRRKLVRCRLRLAPPTWSAAGAPAQPGQTYIPGQHAVPGQQAIPGQQVVPGQPGVPAQSAIPGQVVVPGQAVAAGQTVVVPGQSAPGQPMAAVSRYRLGLSPVCPWPASYLARRCLTLAVYPAATTRITSMPAPWMTQRI